MSPGANRDIGESEPQEPPGQDRLREALVTILGKSLDMRISGGDFGLLDALNEPNLNVSTAAAIYLHDLCRPLADLLQSDNRFPGHHVKLLRGEGGGVGFYPN